jgi:EmrB/QacA subfamily drug resistance transporter
MFDRNHRRAWLGVGAAAVSIFLFVADSALMAVALPAIEKYFPNEPRSSVAWVASSFVISQAAMLLIAGQLGDRRGRKRFYLLGLVVFSLGALMVALAGQLTLIIVGRIVQGCGAAFLTSGALPLVLPLFPAERAPSVIGVWGAIGSVAAWLAPTVGGFLASRNWRYVFLAVLPIALGALALGYRVIPDDEPHARSGTAIDGIGVLLGPPGFGLAMLVLSQGRRWGWAAPRTLGLSAVAVALIIAFIYRCRASPRPLLELRLFANREFSVNVTCGVFQQIGFFSWFLTAPLIMTQLWGWSVEKAGLGLAVSQILATLGSPAAGWLIERVGPYPILVIGALTNASGALWLVLIADRTVQFWTGYVPAALLLGLGASWCGTVSSGTSLAALDRADLGIGNSAQQLIRRIGGSVGVALALSLLGEGRGDALLTGAKRVWLLSVAVHLLTLAPLLAIPKPFARHRRVAVAQGPISGTG